MGYRYLVAALAAWLPFLAGCGASTGNPSSTSTAAMVGRLQLSEAAGKNAVFAQLVGCPEIVISLDGSSLDVIIEDDCSFLVTNIAPAELILLRVELPDLGVAGTVELVDVVGGELIEIEVEAGDESLAIVIVRRATPDVIDELPTTITGNDVTIQVSDGLLIQDLTVLGNSFTLVGEAGDDCGDDGWTILDGDVLINGNDAVFRNIVFLGTIEVRGNAPTFINTCVEGELIVFGNDVRFED